MTNGITVRILGDSGPFSRSGRGVGYHVVLGQESFLLDCGAPVFKIIGGHDLKEITGLIITHCHNDHKRWFDDLSIFHKYAPDVPHRLFLLTSEEINNELMKTSGPALDRSLDYGSKNIIDIAYSEYVDYRVMGPFARYRIVQADEGSGRTRLTVMDRDGNVVGPDRAKIVISLKTGRCRMLFRDPDYKEWVEPESFYSFSSNVFYENNKNAFESQNGYTIEAVKSATWHGIPCIGVKFTTQNEKLIFSSDTVHDEELWNRLCTEKREQKLGMPQREFEEASVIKGDINDYIERMWSRDRYEEATRAFDDAIVIHDVSTNGSAVHTHYNSLKKTALKKNKTILTHSPDKMTSEWVLSYPGKIFKIIKDRYFEVVGEELYQMNADIYYKEEGKYYSGYINTHGKYAVIGKNGVLSIVPADTVASGENLLRVDLYEDIEGRYFPKLEEKGAFYIMRKDGKIELVKFTDKGSVGVVMHGCRDDLLTSLNKREKEIC
ncbi:MAG: hypothetical protein C4538_10310 [Nitrospiraceae bacterium]|nr:MAG: hypothetical protein C4538_10310 [Nitrospiraceae bacterium]